MFDLIFSVCCAALGLGLIKVVEFYWEVEQRKTKEAQDRWLREWRENYGQVMRERYEHYIITDDEVR